MFHLKDGIFFERTPEGGVRIVVGDGRDPVTYGPATVIRDVTIPDNEFASAIASVSARGETHDTFYEAWDLLRLS